MMKSPFLILACVALVNSIALVQATAEEPAKPAALATKGITDRANVTDAAQLELLVPVVSDVRLSTVKLVSRNWGKLICHACVVHENGWFLTKASEVDKYKEVDVQFASSAQFPGGLRLPITVVSRHKEYDVALLKADATGFKPVHWHSATPPSPGSVLMAAGLTEAPIASGVASVEIRSLDIANRGFLGIRLGPDMAIIHIIPKSPAIDAGVQIKDFLVKINDKEIKSIDDFQTCMSKYKPEEKISLEIKRDKETKTIDVQLRRRSDYPEAMQNREDPRSSMSGSLSGQRTGFPSVLQHDLPLRPEDCGTPLVDLDGKVVGLNIARSGRIESLAIPVGPLLELLRDVPKGKLYIPEAEALQKKISDLENTQRKQEEEKERIKKLEEGLTKGLAEAKRRLDALLGGKP